MKASDMRLRLDELLRERSMTQRELARKAGCSEQALIHAKKTGQCSLPLLRSAADALGCGMDELWAPRSVPYAVLSLPRLGKCAVAQSPEELLEIARGLALGADSGENPAR